MINPVKQALKQGKCSLGSWVQIPHPSLVELMADCGFDWITLDAEHAAIDMETAQACFQAMSRTNCMPFVRIPRNDLLWIRRFLDIGAMGVIVPLVNTPEEAARAVAAAKYPPDGERGIGYARANRFGLGFDEYMADANDQIVVIAQIEHFKGVENVEAIAATPGIDGLFIGPYDLSGSMGLLGQFDHPDVRAAMQRVCKAAMAAGIAPGSHVVQADAERLRGQMDEGFRFIAYSLDIIFLQNACLSAVGSFREALAGLKSGS